MGVLEDIQEAIGRMARDAGPSVVGLGQRWGVGSGVVVSSGRVLTNAHNVRGEQTTVTFADSRTAEGRVVGFDLDGDLAVVEVDTGTARAVQWSTETPTGIGTPVFALANPGGRGLRVTQGFVSSVERTFRGPRGRRITGSIEHTALLLPGSSGGPIVDAEGRLLGINTNRRGEGFYLAIPADQALRERVDALARGESAAQPRLGIGIAPGHVARRLRRAVGLPEVDGLLIREVEEGSPAAVAGLAKGDLITEAGGRAAREVDDLFDALESARSGGLELKVTRGTDERVIQVVPGGTSGEGAEAR